jgi:hypothetical protein
MAKKERFQEEKETQTIIPNIGMKQGSWYFPLTFLFTTICGAAIILLISAITDTMQISSGLKIIMMLISAIIIALYLFAMIMLFKEWYKNTKAITDQEIAKAQILFLEAYKKAKEAKPDEALYDETEWIHDLSANLRKNKTMDKEIKK